LQRSFYMVRAYFDGTAKNAPWSQQGHMVSLWYA
jgi:hypothetical protein